MTMTAVAAFAIYVLVHLGVLLTLFRAGAPFLLAEVFASVIALVPAAAVARARRRAKL